MHRSDWSTFEMVWYLIISCLFWYMSWTFVFSDNGVHPLVFLHPVGWIILGVVVMTPVFAVVIICELYMRAMGKL